MWSGSFFFTKQLPPALQLFMMEVFHYKLRVHSRMVTMTESDRCPVCGQVETVEHAFCGCQFHQLLFRLVKRIFSPVPYKGEKGLISQVPLVCQRVKEHTAPIKISHVTQTRCARHHTLPKGTTLHIVSHSPGPEGDSCRNLPLDQGEMAPDWQTNPYPPVGP